MRRTLVILGLLLPASLLAADHPTARISNVPVTAKLYIADPNNGYYRGTRFDWSGVIYSLTYADHEYFGKWQQSDDPYLHDRITGPVESFSTNAKALGYDEVPPGGTFMRIGVGVCEKPKEKDFRWRHTYKVADPGRWTICQGNNWIEFVQEVSDPKTEYGYH
jgi:hypothetical protein